MNYNYMTDDQRYEVLVKDKGVDVRGHYIDRGGVLWPADFHTWQMVTQGKLPAAHKGMILAAKSMAATAGDLVRDAALLARACQLGAFVAGCDGAQPDYDPAQVLK